MTKPKDLLVVSTYGSVAAKEWLDIQRDFLHKYTENYDFQVYLHNVEDETPFRDVEIIGRTSGELLYTLPEMFHEIYHYFRRTKYKNYLLLDSDCFPVKKDWLPTLLKAMEDRWYASPVRTENLDIIPHPCALFIRGEHILKHLFFFRRPAVGSKKNLLGEKVIDIGTGFKTEYNEQNIFFPLLRSNAVNVHPVISAIYGDIFYHYGAGSRQPIFRSTNYWKKLGMYPETNVEEIRENPQRYINKLRGQS